MEKMLGRTQDRINSENNINRNRINRISRINRINRNRIVTSLCQHTTDSAVAPVS